LITENHKRLKKRLKKILKKLTYSPLGRGLFMVIRQIFTPSEQLAPRLKFKGRFKVSTGDGHEFKLYNNAFVFETNIFWLGLDKYQWERTTRKLWNRLASKSDVILDIGANSGLFAVFAKVHNPSARVIAFEPQPNIYYALKKNNEVNNFDIRCEQLALSDAKGEMPFYNYGPDTFSEINTTAGSLNKDWRSDRQHAINVQVDTLKNYLVSHKIEKVDLIKIDVETHEFEVLKGYGDLLLQHRPAIVLEIQDEQLGQRISSLFLNAGYHFYHVDEIRGIQKVEQLWLDNADRNYLICPEEKLGLISDLFAETED
jgi:FkbM family methyltransferase